MESRIVGSSQASGPLGPVKRRDCQGEWRVPGRYSPPGPRQRPDEWERTLGSEAASLADEDDWLWAGSVACGCACASCARTSCGQPTQGKDKSNDEKGLHDASGNLWFVAPSIPREGPAESVAGNSLTA